MARPTQTGSVISFNPYRGGCGFVRADTTGARIFLGGTVLAKCGIKRLATGDRISFDIAKDKFGGTDRAVNVRVIYA